VNAIRFVFERNRCLIFFGVGPGERIDTNEFDQDGTERSGELFASDLFEDSDVTQ